MRKFTSIILSAILVLSVFCVLGGESVLALTSEGYTYSVSGNTATITKYSGPLTNVIIPSSIDGYSVTNIGEKAFFGRTALYSIEIPDSVITIGGYAFYSCVCLKSVTLGNSVTKIDKFAFSDCSRLTSMTIPDSVTSIGQSAFSHCSNLTNITIPNGVTSIEGSTFYGCSSLTSIVIPDSVTSIGNNAFSHCSNLTNITIPNNVTSIDYSGFDDTAYYRNEANWENNVLYIGKHLFKAKESLSGYYNIKAGTFSISNDAFGGCSNLTSLTIPDSVTSIGQSAFSDCSSLTSITIPQSVTNIGWKAFKGCTSLNYAFYNGYKSNLSIASDNDPLIKVLKYAIDNESFNNGEWFFDYTNKVLRITGNGNMELGYNQTAPWSIYSSEIKSVVIESGITSIADYAFTCCTNLSSVTIPNTVTSIGESAFEGCTDLINVIIPNNVSYIAENAFYRCKSIQAINLESNVFIGDGAFTDCTSLKNVYISSSVDAIGDYAFSNCTSLESITIPKCDSPLGQYAFSGCTNLSKIEITNGLPAIGDSAFYGCSSLTSISIPDSVESIGKEAFGNCKKLNSVTIGSGCKSIASKALWDCPNLKKLTIKYPNCIFNDNQYTISLTAVICGYKNSTAYSYARSYMRSFEDIETGVKYGWIDGSFVEIPIEDNHITPTNMSCDEVGHIIELVSEKAATYFTKGYSGKKVCTVCHKVISKGEETAMLKLGVPKVKITAGKKKISVKYTKVKDATGFQVRYIFKGKTVNKIFTANKSVTKTIKKLKKGKYTVKVRALIKSNGKTAYSNWNKTKRVKIKNK